MHLSGPPTFGIGTGQASAWFETLLCSAPAMAE